MYEEDIMKQPLLGQNMNTISNKSNTNQEHRVIPIFPPTDQHEEENKAKEEYNYPPNIIVSSRYNIINFLPKSLLEQFRRLANVYFVVIGVIAAVGAYTKEYETAIDPAGILAPMLIVVFISVIKDGVEDFKRHRADQKINNRKARVVLNSGDIMTKTWKELKVGDLLLLYGDEEVPADVLVLTCGGIQGQTSYVETAAIDGETNLKIKLPALVSLLAETGSTPNFSLNSDRTKVEGQMDLLR